MDGQAIILACKQGDEVEKAQLHTAQKMVAEVAAQHSVAAES